MSSLYRAPSQAFTAKLDGRLTSTDTSAILTRGDGLQAPGLIIIERLDTSGARSSLYEIASYTGVVGDTVTGLTRGLAGTVASDHGSGSIVECYPTITHWNDLRSILLTDHGASGYINITSHVNSLMVTGVSGLSGLKGDVSFIVSGQATVYSTGGASGYGSVVFDIAPYSGGIPQMMVSGGLVSGSTIVCPIIINEESRSIKYVSAMLKYPASGASLVLDINKNFTTIFTDQAYRPTIIGGGTFVSTASIAVKTLSPADLLTLDVDMVSWGGGLTVSIGV